MTNDALLMLTYIFLVLIVAANFHVYTNAFETGRLINRNRDVLCYLAQRGTGNKPNKPEKRYDSKKKSGSNFSRQKASSSGNRSSNDKGADDGVRLNKCLLGLSRRAADDAIASGRVSVNGKIVNDPDKPETKTNAGLRVKRGDKIRLDGALQNWQEWSDAKAAAPCRVLEDRDFVYVKYCKQTGVTCTSDPKDRSNIIAAGGFNLFPQRLFTVGRLDKDSTGLILLTSDGRVNNAMLSPQVKKEKVYEVEMNKDVSESQIQQLRSGVVITTEAQRDRKSRPVTAKTLPCKVRRVGGAARKVEFILTEGKNRQIRKMAEAVGLAVTKLHRTSFAGITLKGLSGGDWLELDEKEMTVVNSALRNTGIVDSSDSAYEYDE